MYIPRNIVREDRYQVNQVFKFILNVSSFAVIFREDGDLSVSRGLDAVFGAVCKDTFLRKICYL